MNITITKNKVVDEQQDERFIIKDGVLVKCNDTSEVITVPEGVHTIGEKVFEKFHFVKEIILPDGLEVIGSKAFAKCEALEKINIPSSVKNIYSYAFYGCRGLKQLCLPSSLTMIGDHCFTDTRFETINIPDSVDCIEQYAFENSHIKEITIPESVKTLGEGVLYHCVELEKVTVKGQNIKLPDRFCSNDGALKTFDLSNVKSIGDDAFYACKSLELAKIPKNVEFIGTEAFARTGSIKNLVIESAVALNQPVRNIFNSSNIESVKINIPDDSIETKIPEKMFFRCRQLKDVTFTGDTSKLKYIDMYAFAETDLAEINIPEGVIDIGPYAFNKCTLLQRVIFPNSLTFIWAYAFAGCGLSEIDLSENVSDLGTGCFSDCAELKTVELNKNISYIPSECFTRCKKLKTLKTGKIKEVKSYAFDCCESLEVFDFSNIENIGSESFRNTGIKNVVFKKLIIDEMTIVTHGAFMECKQLVSVDFSECSEVKCIPRTMFCNCRKLTDLILNKNIVHFGQYCLYKTAIKSISFSENTSAIDECALGELNLTNVKFDENCLDVTIDHNAFRNSTIENLIVPENLYKMYKTSIWDQLK